MLNFIKKLIGTKSDKDIKELRPELNKVLAVEPEIQKLTDQQLRDKTQEFKQRIAEAIAEETKAITSLKAEIEAEEDIDLREAKWVEIDKLEKSALEKTEIVLDTIRPEAFALVRETAKRFKDKSEIIVRATELDIALAAKQPNIVIKGSDAVYKNHWNAAGTDSTWEMVHYDVQLIGGTVLHSGKIAEMATGEGKTLVATLPVYLNALPGKGVHVVTVNDYLARRDSEWMAPIFQFHGLTIDCIDKHQPNSQERRNAYAADITYGTNNEFGFDYLRDNMARNTQDLVQRGHNYAIVDEVDSVLIDDARTPLIISGPTPKGDRHEFNELKPYVEKIVSAQRQVVQEELSKARKLLAEGDAKQGGVHLLRAHRGLPKMKPLIKFLSEEGHRVILQKTENLYMQEQSKNMHIIDDELFFTIDEKHNQIDLTSQGIELLSKDTDRDFFVLTDIGTQVAELEKASLPAAEKATMKDDMMRDFAIKSERIHTMNQLLKAYALFENDIEYVVMDNKVKIVDEQTGRIMEGRRYSDGLHQAIEAKENVKIEAATQTYATITLQNYFRMYNKLSGMTGTAETEAGEFWEIYKLEVVTIPTNRPITRDDREDFVFKTKREKFNAVIDEIQKLRDAGRPILVGTTNVEVSELLSRALKIRKIPHNVLNAKLHQKEADIVAEAGRSGTVTIATNMAGRGTDIKLSPESKAAGGLAIIGTERHDSRRVDRQLRGRSGRQGDPGSSQFFVSLEDNLMRLFGSDRIAGLMDRMGLKEGEVIQHSMVSKSIERAQKKVEENNFGTRKRLLEYDDVMNNQREVIYKRRYHALFGERLQTDIANMVYDSLSNLIETFQLNKDFEGFKLDLYRVFGMDTEISAAEFDKSSIQDLSEKIYKEALVFYKRKNERIAESAYPVIKQVFEQQNSYQNIVVPFTDGVKQLQVVTDLPHAYETKGKGLIEDFEKNIALAIIDDVWKEHLRDLDDLRQSVQGAVYEQKDPLLIYKFESFELFKAMVDRSNKEIISFLFKGNLPAPDPSQMRRAPIRQQSDMSNLQTSRPGAEEEIGGGEANPTQAPRVKQVVNEGRDYGRNEIVSIRKIATGEQKTLKYKQAQPLVASGQWMIEN